MALVFAFSSTTGSALASVTALRSRSTIGAGNPFGPTIPHHDAKVNGVPASAVVGTCGNCELRAADVTASRRTLSLLACGAEAEGVARHMSRWPPRRSVKAGAMPR